MRWALYLRPIFEGEEMAYYIALRRSLWGKGVVLVMIDLIWCEICLLFFGVYLGEKMNYSWSRRNLNQKSSGQCLCSSSASVVLFFIWIVFHSSCFWFIYFKEQETDASEYGFECCCLIHTSNTMKFWKVSLHNILSAIMGLWCLLIWGVSQIQTKCGFGCLVTDTRFITACSSAYVTLLTQN